MLFFWVPGYQNKRLESVLHIADLVWCVMLRNRVAVVVQALVNENLDFADKTKCLETALVSANKLLTELGMSPQEVVQEGSLQDQEGCDKPVQLVVNVTDAKGEFNNQARIIILWHYVAQLQVYFSPVAHLKHFQFVMD